GAPAGWPVQGLLEPVEVTRSAVPGSDGSRGDGAVLPFPRAQQLVDADGRVAIIVQPLVSARTDVMAGVLGPDLTQHGVVVLLGRDDRQRCDPCGVVHVQGPRAPLLPQVCDKSHSCVMIPGSFQPMILQLPEVFKVLQC